MKTISSIVRGNTELKELINNLEKDKIKMSTANKGIKWHFNAPLGPHLRGVFETMIKVAKRAVNNILGNADITVEELYTAFTGSESLLNVLPLTYQRNNMKDVMPLTPNYLLFGQVGGEFSLESVETEDYHPKKLWR